MVGGDGMTPLPPLHLLPDLRMHHAPRRRINRISHGRHLQLRNSLLLRRRRHRI